MRKFGLVRQVDAPWGVARLSTGSNPLDNFDFVFDDSAGEGTDVYGFGH